MIVEQLDLVEEDDQITHFVTIEEQCDPEDQLSMKAFPLYVLSSKFLSLDVFKFDPEYMVNEEKYKQIRDGMIFPYIMLLFLYGVTIFM